MESKLQIKTRWQQEDAGEEPVSPSGQYFNSKTLSVCILAVLEFEIPIDDSCAMDLLQNLFLPINPRFSSIMVMFTLFSLLSFWSLYSVVDICTE